MKRFLSGVFGAAACIAALLLAAPSATLAITAVATIPTRGSVSYGADAVVSLSWRVTASALGTVLTSSSGGLYSARGTLLGTVGTVLTATPTGTIATIPESFTLTRGVIMAAVADGAPVVYLQRTFTEPSRPSVNGTFPIDITGVPAATPTPTPMPTPAATPTPRPCGLSQVLPFPATTAVALGQAPLVSIRWEALFRAGETATGATSPSGSFRTSSGASLGGGGAAVTLSPFAGRSIGQESLLVPREVIYRAWKAGATRILYVRDFEAGGCLATAQVAMDVTGAGAAGFALQRIALRFADGALAGIVGEGDPLQAYADISSAGSGFLEGAWEVADLSPGTPLYRTLALVSEHLLAPERTTLASPPLPTGGQGIRLVRFRVTNPAGIKPPTIRYAVGSPAAGGASIEPAFIAAEGPDEGAQVSPGAHFGWSPVPGAKVYQVELHEWGAASRFVSGMLIPGDRLGASLSAAAFWHLAPGRNYRWRIVALGEGGVVIGESPLKEFRTQ